MVAYQFGNQLLSHGSNEEILLLRESCVDRLSQLQSMRISESIQTTQAHLHLPNNVQGKRDIVTGNLEDSFFYVDFIGLAPPDWPCNPCDIQCK